MISTTAPTTPARTSSPFFSLALAPGASVRDNNAPLGTASTLYAAPEAPGSDPDDEYDDADSE